MHVVCANIFGAIVLKPRFKIDTVIMIIQGADDKLGQFLSQDIWATANHRNCLQHSLESCPSPL